MKNNFQKVFITNNLNSKKFKFIVILLIIISLYSCFDIVINVDYFMGIYKSYCNIWVVTLLSFSIFLNVLNICENYKKNYSLIIRHQNFKNHINELIKIIIISNVIIIFMSFMITSAFIFLKYPGYFNLTTKISDINILIYLIIYFLKFNILLSLLSLIIFFFWWVTNYLFTYVLALLLSTLFIIYPTSLKVTHFKFFYGYYLTNTSFDNFTIELNYAILEILLFSIINYLLYKISNYIKKDVG